MTLPPEIVARWLPDWRAFAEAALAAAQAPQAEPVALNALAQRASTWPSPCAHKRDQYVGAVLIWAAKAYCKQDSALMRQTLDGVLLEAALAFQTRLERAAKALEPERRNDRADALAFAARAVVPLRKRRDIDDVDEEG